MLWIIYEKVDDTADRKDLEVQLAQMDTKWSGFRCEVGETRKSIDVSIEYFSLVEEVEQSFRQGSQLLVSVARQSAQVKTPEEAKNLLQEVDGFIRPHQAELERKLTHISELAVQLYGSISIKLVHFIYTLVEFS